MLKDEIINNLGENYKTKDVDLIIKDYIKNNIDISSLKPYILDNSALYRIYFAVSLSRFKAFEDKLNFIDEHLDYLNAWYHTDMLIQMIRKGINFDLVYDKAKCYVNDSRIYVRRWGYVIFISGLQKERANFEKIINLLHNDNEYMVQMAQAWLLADLCVFMPDLVYDYMRKTTLKYNITGKAIQKICDSYRISNEHKEAFKALRNNLKEI